MNGQQRPAAYIGIVQIISIKVPNRSQGECQRIPLEHCYIAQINAINAQMKISSHFFHLVFQRHRLPGNGKDVFKGKQILFHTLIADKIGR